MFDDDIYRYQELEDIAETHSWITRCSLSNGKIECLETKTNSIIIENTSVTSVLEFADEKMLVAIQDGTNILIVEDWKQVREIKEPSLVNQHKYWLQKMPGFDEERFPFCIT